MLIANDCQVEISSGKTLRYNCNRLMSSFLSNLACTIWSTMRQRKKVLILGLNGMLGRGVARAFSGHSDNFEVFATTRPGTVSQASSLISGDIKVSSLEAGTDDLQERLGDLGAGITIINCIGIVKSQIDPASKSSRLQAISVNSIFPHHLAEFAERNGHRVLQIGTDCVFSGDKGAYVETDPHDCSDVYGQSKSIGEVESESTMVIRSSIVGPEVTQRSLWGWLASLDRNAQIGGYIDHLWNGVTSQHFGGLCAGLVMSPELFSPGTQHWLPADVVTKFELVTLVLERLGRYDVVVESTQAGTRIDRSLATVSPEANSALWEGAGYSAPPTISQLVAELDLTV